MSDNTLSENLDILKEIKALIHTQRLIYLTEGNVDKLNTIIVKSKCNK